MHNKKPSFRNATVSVSFVLLLSALFLMTSGCTPLRKKFTRKKKEKDSQDLQFIPVLDPIDYPAKIYSAKEKYSHHYSLWQIWSKDLLQNIEMNSSEKRQKYLLNQTLEQLGEMKILLADQKQNELEVLIGDLRKVQQIYEKPSAMRNKISVKKKIELNAKAIRNGFSSRLELPFRDQL